MTIIVLILLAGVSIHLVLGPNGIVNKAKEASGTTKKESAVEKVQLMLADYLPERQIEEKALEEYLNEQKEKGKLEEVTNNGDNTITVEVDGYEITIKEDELSIIKVEKAEGIRPRFTITTTKENGDNIIQSEEENVTKKAITINITNIAEYGENYTIEVIDAKGSKIEKETNVITGLTGQASFIIVKSGKYTITVSGTKDGITRQTIKTENIKVAMEQIEETEMFSKVNGVIDIVWLDLNNNVIQSPISPAEYLGGLEAVQYDEKQNDWVLADTKKSNNWYNYEEQIGINDAKTSHWANARTSDGNAYFVWIPRYAYKITYFNNVENANHYRENSNSTEGIIGYSTIEGIIDVTTGTPKLVTESEPSNVDISKPVNNDKYSDYIPHPAFEFAGSKAGIWVGKFECSGTKSTAISEGEIKIIPNVENLRELTAGEIFTACQKVKTKYSLTNDSHMMKNTEWGVTAYLAESKYGRNGTKVIMNNDNYITGGGDYASSSNVEQSTTGNVYGVYDMSGTTVEYVAGVNALSNGSYYDFTNIHSKYYDIYTNYEESKRIKGDAIYETSTPTLKSACWHGKYVNFLTSTDTMLYRGRYRKSPCNGK